MTANFGRTPEWRENLSNLPGRAVDLNVMRSLVRAPFSHYRTEILWLCDEVERLRALLAEEEAR